MTVLDDVQKLMSRLSPAAICDDFIADKLGVSVRQHANRKTRELAGTGGFERRKDICGAWGRREAGLPPRLISDAGDPHLLLA